MKFFKTAFLSIIIMLCAGIAGFPLSESVRTLNDYNLSLGALRSMKIMVENFGDKGMKDEYGNVQGLFQKAGEDFYGQDFPTSHAKFRKVKDEIIVLLQKISKTYLERTKSILDSTSKQTFHILISYSKKSGNAEYFRRPFNPLTDRDFKAYDPVKYHYYHDRDRMENCLRNGYKNLYKATLLFNDPEIEFIRKKKNLQSENLNWIIERYLDIVSLCRDAKENGIEIHRILNDHELGKVLVKYNITSAGVKPVYDERIPEEYRVDANDNQRFIHSVELQRIIRDKDKGGDTRDTKK